MDDDRVAEDEDGIPTNQESIPMNEYPDLDYVPKYPWLGEHITLDDDQPLSSKQPTSPDGITQDSQGIASHQGLPSKEPDRPGDGSLNPYSLPSAGDPHDPSLDPDFQLSEEGTAYVSQKFVV